MLYSLDALGIFVFLFIFWKKLKDDYVSSQIFSTAFFILISLAIATFVAQKFFPLYWFWLSFLALVAGLYFGMLRYKMRFYESLEAEVVGFAPWLAFVYLDDSVKNQSWFSFSLFIFVVFLIWLYLFLLKHYKNFSWYRSGRVGFAGLGCLGIFFLVRALLASIFPFMLSFVGKFDAIISSLVSFIIFLLIYNLSRKI
jgi:hypothetical protein